jgi:hypothetical protein
MDKIRSQKAKLKAKRAFLKKGTCSRTFFYILNRDFGFSMEAEEAAADPLAGGILQQGYQCGMLWGASMAIGAESYRRYKNPNEAISMAVQVTQGILQSFFKEAKSIECAEITSCDMTKTSGLLKLFFSGKFVNCFRLAGKWAPDAIETARKGMAINQELPKADQLSCASEVIKNMGGSEQESIMVAGFAGGLGLSGSGCGALAAAIWKQTLNSNTSRAEKSFLNNKESEKLLNSFYKESEHEMICSKICGRTFSTLDEHTEYIKKGGCKKLMDILSAG